LSLEITAIPPKTASERTSRILVSSFLLAPMPLCASLVATREPHEDKSVESQPLTYTPPKTMHHQTEQLSDTADFFSRRVEPVPQRVREIAMLRGLGYSFREIASQYHVTPQAVSLMLARHKKSAKSLCKSTELTVLSSRAVNALGRLRIVSREEARRRNALDLLKGARNCGRKTLEEISSWIGDETAHRG
jgi:hypothetical protein